MRCVTSPVLIWLGCTLCTCKVCLLLLRRRCQCSTRASVRTTGAVSSKHSAVSSRIDRQTELRAGAVDLDDLADLGHVDELVNQALAVHLGQNASLIIVPGNKIRF